MNSDYNGALRTLAELHGVITGYHKASRERPWIEATPRQLQLHLEAREIPCASLGQVSESIALRQRELLTRPVQPVYSTSPTVALPLRVLLPPGYLRYEVSGGGLPSSNGRLHVVEHNAASGPGGEPYDRYELQIPNLDRWGIFDLQIRFDGHAAESEHRSRVIVGPDQFWAPPGDKRYYGVTTMLSSLHSTGEHSLGRGNSAAAREAIRYLSDRKASFLALGPIQLFDFPYDVPGGSPFMPLSLDMLTHHCLDAVSAAKRLGLHRSLAFLGQPLTRARITRLNACRRVDLFEYDRLLFEMLQMMYAEFNEHHLAESTSCASEFRSFVERRGAPLRLAATFLALRQHFFPPGSTSQMWDFEHWPAEFRRPDTAAVVGFAREQRQQVELIEFIQWLVDGDLIELRRAAKHLGMELGLWTNIPVGLSSAPADKWAQPKQFFKHIRMGCPPDPLAEGGQSWNYPVRDPEALLDAGLEPILAPVRLLATYFDGAENDHGMSVERVFGYPAGASAADGVYIRFPLEHILRAYMLLSHQHKFLFAPELVGTKSERIDGVMQSCGAVSLTQHRYERHDNGALKLPHEYAWNSLIFGGGHNHFPDIAWLVGLDIEYGVRYRNDAAADVVNARRLRAGDVVELLSLLVTQGLLDQPDAEALQLLAAQHIGEEELLQYAADSPLLLKYLVAVHRLRSRAASRYLAVDLLEALGTHPAALNMPGETPTFPGWREKSLPISRWPTSPLELVLHAVTLER